MNNILMDLRKYVFQPSEILPLMISLGAYSTLTLYLMTSSQKVWNYMRLTLGSWLVARSCVSYKAYYPNSRLEATVSYSSAKFVLPRTDSSLYADATA
jgi:hypothetical protein